MKQLRLRLCLVILIIFNSGVVWAQSEITLEDIWTTGKFRAEDVYGIRSLNDGEHYTVLEGGEVRRPSGQTLPVEANDPIDGPSRLLDYEFELGFSSKTK